VPFVNSETGKVMSEREAYMDAITDRIHQIEQHGPEEEKSAREIPLCHLRHEFQVISDRFDRQNRELRAAGQKPLEEATLRPQYVRAIHTVQDEAATYPRPYDRWVAKSELRLMDRKLEVIQNHYEKHNQEQTNTRQEPSHKPSQRQQS